MFERRFAVEKEVEFDTGHRVPLHESKCKNPHGHRYRVIARVTGPLKSTGSETGMVVDFGHIKELLTTRVHDRFDHAFVVQDSDTALKTFLLSEYGSDAEVAGGLGLHHADWRIVVVPFAPTAENMAEDIYDDLEPLVAQMGPGVELEWVRVYETPTGVAQYPA